MQITFKDRALRNGFKIVVTDSSRVGRDAERSLWDSQNDDETPIAGCVHERVRSENRSVVLLSTCHAATIVRLRPNDKIALTTIDDHYRPMLMSEHLTYWGLYKIG